MSGQIFISYRREESRWSARSIHDRLRRDFDRKQIFMDIDAIALGEDFVEAIETTVGKCDVLIAVIGNNWLTPKDDHSLVCRTSSVSWEDFPETLPKAIGMSRRLCRMLGVSCFAV